MTEARRTHNPHEIRLWIEARHGRPAIVRATGEDARPGGLLRIDFGDADPGLEQISWEEFFETFEANKLDFLHQDKTAEGKPSRFNKFVARDGGHG